MEPFVSLQQAANWLESVKVSGDCSILKQVEHGLALIYRFNLRLYRTFANKGVRQLVAKAMVA